MTTTATPTTNPDLQQALERYRDTLGTPWIDELFPRAPNAVYTASVITHLMIYQRLHGNAPLHQAVAELLRCLERLPSQQRVTAKTLSANTGAYSRARAELPVAVAQQIADRLTYQQFTVYPPTLGTQRVFFLDGTTLTLPHTPELVATFPPARNQHGTSHWPIVRLVVAHELSSGCALRPEYGALRGTKAADEVRLALRLLDRVPARSLLMCDANFGIFAFVYGVAQAGHDVLARLTIERFHALQRAAKPVGPGQWSLNWRPSRYERKHHPELPAAARVHVQLYEVVVSPTLTLYLVATRDRPATVWADLYHQRGRVETDIFDVKITLQLEQTRVQSVALWEKEACLGYVAYNLVVQVRRLAACAAGIEPRTLSFAGTRSLVEQLLLQANVPTAADWETLFERVMRAVLQRKLPRRTNPQRRYPRTIIPRGRKYPFRSHPPATPPPVA